MTSRAMLPAALLLLIGAAGAQMDIQPKPKSYVAYIAEPQLVRAGKLGVLEFRFRVVDGFHINSHVPKSQLLLPTALAVAEQEGIKTGTLEYPPGKVFTLSADPSEKLDVYSGDFALKLPVVAQAGEHSFTGTLRYQACDNKACYPPKTLPVQVMFTAK